MSRTPKYYMTDGDIITDFRQAKDKKAQIEILADLNCVSREQMREKLRELGLLPGGPPPKPKPKPEPKPEPKPKPEPEPKPAPILPAPHKQPPARPPMDELRAMELFNEGLDDLQIAEALGETKNRVVEWRYRMHLLRPRGGASEKQKQQRAEGLYGKKPPKEAFQPKKKSAVELLLGKQKKYGRLDTARARELYDQGLGDQRIGNELDVAKETVASWRRKSGLPSQPQLAEAKRNETKEDEAMIKDSTKTVSEISPDGRAAEAADPEPKALTVEGLARMLDTLRQLGGEVDLLVGGKPLRGAQLTIRCGSDGEPERTVLALEV